MVTIDTEKPLKESELVNKFLWEKYRTNLQWRRVRLGVLPSKELSRMYMVTLRWADAIVIHEGNVLIIEAKLSPRADAVGQLLLYEKLFKNTPEFKQYWNNPIKKVFLCPKLDTQLAELCSEKEIEYVVYDPRK